MKYGCPNSDCDYFKDFSLVIKNGVFKRKSDCHYVQKYKCKACKKQFSKATFSMEKYQKKRRINREVLVGLSSGVSMRRLAKNLNVNQKTIKAKLVYLAKVSQIKNEKFLEKLQASPVTHLQFDDLITIEHTKLKPLSVSIAVDANRRFILGAQVSKIAAFGHLSELSKKKYGKRKSEHKKGLKILFEQINKVINPRAIVRSDEHNFYPDFVKKYLPQVEHQRFKGGRGCVVGQGELKKLKKDPLFSINHTCAMFRANINRLIRKTWCTTKDPDMLQKHIEIFIYYFNHIYLDTGT